ncbi:MAG: rhodanese-like domain-containing protein [Cyclobacteriaceae bacterium]|nr:rhodanese-like domain-containing protein [Cyclobacteriaceae bacterium]
MFLLVFFDVTVRFYELKSEYEIEHLVGAENFPLDFVNKNISAIDPEKDYYVHCAGGYRSVIFSSILKSRGYHRLKNILGGFKALSDTNLKRSELHQVNTEL